MRRRVSRPSRSPRPSTRPSTWSPSPSTSTASGRRFDAFLRLDGVPDGLLDPASVKGSQAREPLFEFSGACAGCGETPYLKLLTQLFGDRALVANATGCSSIYGGNLPTTPWGTDAAGRGPAWSNSLFEDNAEFGLGMRIALDRQSADRAADRHRARTVARRGAGARQSSRSTRRRPSTMPPSRRNGPGSSSSTPASTRLVDDDDAEVARRARALAPLTGTLVRKNVWIVGGDGWAYDIGAGGLDHVLGSGRDVNVLVLDTEVYSNTGGQASKSTPRAAVAKFASGGKRNAEEGSRRRSATLRQRLHRAGRDRCERHPDGQGVRGGGGVAGTVADHRLLDVHRPRDRHADLDDAPARRRALGLLAAVPLPSRHRRAHAAVPSRQQGAVDPAGRLPRRRGTVRDARPPNPEEAAELLTLAQADVDERWRYYAQLAGMERSVAHLPRPLRC